MNIPNLECDSRGKRMINKMIQRNYPEFCDFLNKTYPEDISFDEKLYWFKNNITKYQTCKCCNERVKFITLLHGYRKYCSAKCCNSDPDKIKLQQETTFKHYGVLNPSQNKELQNQKKITCEKHYEGGYKSKVILDKLRKTKLERYGDPKYTNPEKRKKTFLEHYGVDHPSKSKEIMEKKRQTNLKHFGKEWSCQLVSARNYTNNSSPNRKFEQLLKDNDISYEREFTIDHYSYDFKVGDILIEIDPIGTHNGDFGIFGSQPRPKNYHIDKTKKAVNNNFRCIHVWDWDNIDKIINILKSKKRLYARNCNIKLIGDRTVINTFLDKYHLQGSCRSQIVCLGLYDGNNLVEVMTFGKPRYNKRVEYELLRLCTNTDYIVVGGAEKLFKYFVTNFSPKNIVSYCDMSKFTGKIYTDLGFDVYRLATPSKHWYKDPIHVTDNLLRQRGFDQLFKTNYGKGISNEQLMYDHKFLTLWDCGQNTYIWTKKEEA